MPRLDLLRQDNNRLRHRLKKQRQRANKWQARAEHAEKMLLWCMTRETIEVCGGPLAETIAKMAKTRMLHSTGKLFEPDIEDSE